MTIDNKFVAVKGKKVLIGLAKDANTSEELMEKVNAELNREYQDFGQAYLDVRYGFTQAVTAP